MNSPYPHIPVVPASAAKDPLLQPLTIRHFTFRNRILSTSHATAMDEGGMPKERYQRYTEEKARGGAALVMFGGSSMVSSDTSWGGGQVDISDDRIIPYLQQFSTRIHAQGAALMMQISHLGRRGDSMSSNWLPTLAPSRIRETRHRNFPREMDLHDIRRIVREYGEAVARAREGGLDGVETLTSGHLMGQFLSPATNLRTDSFGGSLENRMRFCLMVHEELRKQAGDDFIIGLRMTIDEETDGWLSFEEGLRIAQTFEREGTIDFVNAIYGRADKEIILAESNMPYMSVHSAPYLDLVGEFKRGLKLPVFHAAKIQDVATARHALREGLVDMVGMTRAQIADPYLVEKIVKGEEDRIRPCVGASYCMYKKGSCIHNPASGREEILPQTIARAAKPGRRVVVVGGGPAGLEAARVAAERGHHVSLLEAADSLGGQILLAARTVWRKELLSIVDWRIAELQRLEVDVRLGVYADEADVLALSPDCVIVATGGMPDLTWIEGHELCTSTWDVLANPKAAEQDVIVYDAIGQQHAPTTALQLHAQGSRLKFFTLDDKLAVEMPYSERAVIRKKFVQARIPVEIDQVLVLVRRDGAELVARFEHELTGEFSEHRAAQVVVEYGTIPNSDVFDALRAQSVNDGVTDNTRLLAALPQVDDRGQGFELHRIGDAVTSRNIHAAIYDALRLCAAL
ncbi:NADH:flavin oxidoreductase [Caballeronia sp. AZ7_KS35]|uniref:NADH:flavin oxidoreductase n=1 Tax=Caballeronia sp. AZ7_KS35 TaxID=2921762 RepID=UPI002027DDBF|nr:NADH:flavin oxidoreductase [Caballeronia sp. AZ7_KS35]